MGVTSSSGEHFESETSLYDKPFLRVISILTAGLLGSGTTLYALIFLYFFLANAFFLVSELRSFISNR